MVERHKRWSISVLISFLILSGCDRGGSRKEFFRVDRAYLMPERVKKGESVELEFEAISDQGDIELQIEWRRNGLPIEDVHSSELSSFYFQKGDSIWAHVLLRCSGEVVRAFNLGPVVCINSPPAISKIEISTLDSTTLSATVEYEDIDGDSVTITKKWHRNGAPFHKGETLTTKLLHRGDTVMVEASPYDGEAKGHGMRSAPIVIGNHPPRIVSTPPRINGTQYVYQIDAEDPDEDELRFNLKYGPDGMEINSMGLLNWAKGEQVDSVYTVEVEVLDGYGGTAIQKFELKIEEVARDKVQGTSK